LWELFTSSEGLHSEDLIYFNFYIHSGWWSRRRQLTAEEGLQGEGDPEVSRQGPSGGFAEESWENPQWE
jgi:hypothetical protein